MGHPLDTATAYDFTFDTLDGSGPLPLSQLRGRALLVVNVASACGYTPQYRDLEALYAAKSAKGLTVIGVPCNDFGAQERGDDATIQNFCASRYNVSFPMTRKVEIVANARRHPFYQWVARQIGEDALPKWNFHKYLVDRSGALVGTFAPAVTPLGQELLAAVQKAVAVADPAPAVSQAS